MPGKTSIVSFVCVSLTLMNGCSIFGPTDEKLVKQTLTNWQTALEQKDIDKMMQTYSDSFTGQQGEDKAHVREFLLNMKEQGLLDNLELSFDGTKISISEGVATASPVKISGDFGETNEFIITWTLKKDQDKIWRFTGSRME